MNEYTLYWKLPPPTDAEYALTVVPFNVVLRGNTMALTTRADQADEKRVRERADRVAHSLAKSLSYENGDQHEIVYTGDLVVTANGQRHLSAIAGIINVKPVLSLTI